MSDLLINLAIDSYGFDGLINCLIGMINWLDLFILMINWFD